jgi:predicted regulator of Ras-like GTPase activity (Roadblock/LC7/MglB family)
MSAATVSAIEFEEQICRARIDALVESRSEIDGAIVSTVDGFEVTASLRGELSAAKLSAMTSSLLALAEAISSESGIGACYDMVIEASGGRLLLMEIPRKDRQLLLTVLCDRESTMGQVLWAVRRCRDEIVEGLASK